MTQRCNIRNCTRFAFLKRYKGVIDLYNTSSSENEDYNEQIVKLFEELQQENNRATIEGLTEEKLEIYDLLVKHFADMAVQDYGWKSATA